MNCIPVYEKDPMRRRLTTQVVAAGVEGERPFALTAETIFYPEGGGQPCDRGRLGAAAVLEVARQGGELRHYLDRPVAEGEVELELDWDRRWDHMQQHTAQHLLTALAQDQYGWATTAFHLGEQLCDIELDVSGLNAGQLAALEDLAAMEILAAHPVGSRLVDAAGFAGLPVRTRGLPAGHVGDIRLVEIEGVDLNTCGGTHLEHTGQVGALALVGTESLRGGTRLFFVAGDRVRRRLRRAEERHRELRSLLGVPDAELAAAVAQRLERGKEDARRLRSLAGELARAEAGRLAALPDPVVGMACPQQDAAFLQALGSALAEAAPAKIALFTAGTGAGGAFLLVTGAEGPADLAEPGKAVAGILAGRGGGRGRRYQGKATAPENHGQALARLRGMVEGD